MSGGGRCNFTNYYIKPDCYISHNPHFCKSALSRYTQWDFIELVNKHHIPFHEKTLGRLFCDHKSQAILDMLLHECHLVNSVIQLDTSITLVSYIDNYYQITTNHGSFRCKSLVIASGGLSIPTMGSSPFGYKIAEQFHLPVWPTRAGLVPFTLHVEDKERFAALSGVSVDSLVSNQRMHFRENILFTHRGLSGPAILQISSYWLPGETVTINLLPEVDLYCYLKSSKSQYAQKQVRNVLGDLLPKRVLDVFLATTSADKQVANISDHELQFIASQFNGWKIKPNGTEGYRTAEVTLGGVDVNYLSSKTMECKHQPGLYFIGEVVDVTGWLGGYNFQWAWSSGWAAGQVC